MPAKNLTVAKTATVKVTPTVSASPDYAVADVLGGKMTISDATLLPNKGGVLHSIVMTCDVDIPSGVEVDVLLFDTDPAASTFTDNGALAVNVADLHFLVGVAQLTTRIDLGTPACLVATGLNLAFESLAAIPGTMYAVAVVRSAATLNLAGTGEINFLFHILQD